MPTLPLYTVDAFAEGPFTGNPAAVCPVNEKVSDENFQKIAAEMNLSETSFVELLNSGDTFNKSSKFALRWFTPTTEVPLCGHATFAAAATLFYEFGNSNAEIEFVTRESGSLFCKRKDDLVSINLPVDPVEETHDPDLLNLAKVVSGGFPVHSVHLSKRLKMPVVRLQDNISREEFERIQPDFGKMKSLPKSDWVILTAKASAAKGFVDLQGQPFDFVSRFFAPGYGILEDPVTGAAHTALSHYWSKEFNRDKFYARQCSKRGGNIHIELLGDRVELSGRGAVIIKGHMSF